MKWYNLLFFALVLSGFFISCAPAYTPNMVNAPLFSSKGEVQAVIGTGTSGVDPQLAYAITDHVGVMVNASFANRSDTSKNFHKHNFAELGGGYTTTFGNVGRFEVYGGGGMGSINAMYKEGIFDGRSSATFNRFFIQPSIGVVTDVFDGAFTPRLVFLNMHNSNDSLKTNPMDLFLEPTITAKVGWKYIKAMFQIGLSVPLNEVKNYGNQPFMFSIGLVGKIPLKSKAK
jgi:hypothetical protein